MKIIRYFYKFAKYSLISSTVILITVTLLTSFLLFTHSGNQGVIKIAKHFEPRLSIDLIEGSLFYSPKYENIRWLDGELDINITTLDYTFDWSCLFTGLCLKTLNAQGTQIILPETNQQQTPEAEVSSEPFVLDIPFEVSVDNINLQQFHFSIGELAVDLQEISLQADAFKNDVSLSSNITDLIVTLANSAEPVSPAKAKPSVSGPKRPVNLKFDSLPAILTADMLPVISLPMNLNVEPIIIDSFKLVQDKEILFELNTLQTQFKFNETQLSISQFTLDIEEAAVNLSGDVNFIEDYPLKVDIDGKFKTIKQLQPSTLLSEVNFTLLGQGSLSDLNTELILSNKINLQLKSQLDLFTANLPHVISLNWQDIKWPLSGTSEYSSKQGTFTSKGSLLAHEIYLQTDYSVTDLPKGKVSMKTKGDLQHLQIESLKLETLNGEVDFSGLLSWNEQIDWIGQLSIKGIDLQQLESAYDGQLSGLIKQQASVKLYENSTPEWQFDFPQLDIDGSLLSRPLSADGRVSGDHYNGIKFDNLAIHNADNTFIINGLLAEQNDLKIALDVKDISHAMIGTTGRIKGQVNLNGPQDALLINSHLSAQDLSYQQYELENVQIETSVTLADKPNLTLALEAESLTVENQLIDSINIKVSNKSVEENNFRHQIELIVNSELISTDLQVFLTQTDKEFLTQFNQAKLYLPYQTLTLSTPFEVTSQKDNIELSAHCWKATANNNQEIGANTAGQLCIKELSVGEAGNVVLNIDDYLLANANPFLPEEFKLAGAISADADVTWSATNKPDFSIKLFSNDMLFKIKSDPKSTDINDFPMKTFNIDVSSHKNDVNVDAVIFADNLVDVKLKGQLQPYKNKPTINSNVDINVPDFSLFLPLITSLDDLKGNLNSQLSITGNISNPIVDGAINIQDTQISSTDLPMKISELQAAINVNNTKATVQGLFNTSGTNTAVEKKANIPILTDTLNIFDKSVKTVSEKITIKEQKKLLATVKNDAIPGVAYIQGQVDWSKKLRGDIHFYAHKLEVYDYGKIDLFVSPDVHVKIDKNIQVLGGVFIDRGKIVVKELPAGAVSQSKDIIVIDVEKENIAPDVPIIINLSVDMGDDFQVVALGLDTFINGKLLIKKELTKDLTINGELKFVDGSYRSLGQQLVLQNSRVTFQGAPEAPYLKIEAIRDPSKIEDSVVAGVRVTGTPDELELVIFSEPAMAQQEALSYLTRGQSLNNSNDSSTMANMLIDVAAGQSGGVMSTIGEEVGIKDLSISSSGTGDDQSVGVSGEIAPGVEISYGVGVFDSFSIFAIRYEMFERFYIEASSGIDQAIDAYYEWDWD